MLDVGQFAQAYSVLDFEADEGSRLALEYAQSFRDTDGLNRSSSWGHVNQYTAKAGRQTYMSTDTFGCKYVVVQVVGGRVRLLGHEDGQPPLSVRRGRKVLIATIRS